MIFQSSNPWKYISIFFCMLSFPLLASPDLYYRSVRSGPWHDVTTWETSLDASLNMGWQPANTAPDYTSQTIYISNHDTVVITSSVIMDEVIVMPYAMLIYGNYSGSIMTIVDGPGIDLKVEGTFEDSGPSNVGWISSQSSWALGNDGIMVRTRSTSATLWRDHYENGMANIPSSSSWIIRKQTIDSPSISGVNTWYGNLKIENSTTTFWNANLVGSKVSGISSAPVIKGNLVIGMDGISGLKFYSQNSAVAKIKILGDLRIGPGSEFHLEDAPTTSGASGFELSGNLIVEGVLSYDVNEAGDLNRMIVMSGSQNQYIEGAGTIYCFNFRVSKFKGSVVLKRDFDVQNKLILEYGNIDLNSQSMTLYNGTDTAIERTDGWIRSERSDLTSVFRWKIENNIGVYEFPFGKPAEYIPVIVTSTNGNVGMVSIATYPTDSSNRPLPIIPVVTNTFFHGTENGFLMVDRFWFINRSGTGSASYSLTYGVDEVTGYEEIQSAIAYDHFDELWMEPLCCQSNSFPGRKVTIPDATRNEIWTLLKFSEPLVWKSPDEGKIVQDESKSEMTLFPIPSSDFIRLDYRDEEEYPVAFTLFTSAGEKILEGLFLNNSDGLYELDLSSVNKKGILYLQVMNSFSVKTYKILKE